MTVLFVCTGNTCRSPMAAALFADLIAKAGKTGIKAASAGISAYPGMPASSESIRVMEERDLDIRGHLTRLLTPDLIEKAGLILCMNRGHLRAARALGAGDKACLLSEYASGKSIEIEDPFGRGIGAYRSCAAQLHAYLSQAARIV
jgi:protein-tyrosine-phosphatase